MDLIIKTHQPLHEDFENKTSGDVSKTKSNRLSSATVQAE
jgi:hypothetical protein